MQISIVVPVLNEVAAIRTCLENLFKLKGDFEIIAADGGSQDGTVDIIKEIALRNPVRLRVLENIRPGRSWQMNAGAEVATGDVILFLHADCTLHPLALKRIELSLDDNEVIGGGFYKRYSNENTMLWIYRVGMNFIRTKCLKNLVGTNAIFIRKKTFFQLGSFPEVVLLEDVMFSDRMKTNGKLVFLRPHVVASSRRYRESGVLKQIAVAFKIMYLYRIKHKQPDELKRVYQDMKRPLA